MRRMVRPGRTAVRCHLKKNSVGDASDLCLFRSKWTRTTVARVAIGAVSTNSVFDCSASTSSHEKDVVDNPEKAIMEAEGRLIITTFSSAALVASARDTEAMRRCAERGQVHFA